jgi:Glycosyl transferase family 2
MGRAARPGLCRRRGMVSGGKPVGTELPATNPPVAAPGSDAVPCFVRQVIAEARAARLEPVRLRPPPGRGLIMISVVRNEIAILGDFLAHHRGLGIDRFVMLDNGSDDGTAELLAEAPDVDLYRVGQRFLPPVKQGWIMRAIARYGYDRWYAYADADEHLVYDGAGERSLGDMIAFAEQRGLRRVRGMLVDMYAAGPVLAARQGATLVESFPLFDSDSYRETLCKQRISRHGGPRQRKFSSDRFRFSPELTKYPLFHISEGETFDNPHHLYPYKPNFDSPCLLAILHYKFNGGFAEKIRDAVRREQYFGDSREYKHYLEVLSGDSRLALPYPGSCRYRGPADLVACGLIAPIPDGRRGSGLLGWLGRSKPAAG